MKSEASKPLCHRCKHRRNIPGSAHSCCAHPAVGSEIAGDPFLEAMAIFAGVQRVPGFTVGGEKLNIKGNTHGIRMGWFVWPFNFDPIWLENCDGFERKEGC